MQAAQEFFFNGFYSFLLQAVFLLYNCSTIVHVTPHSSHVARNEVHQIQHFTNKTNLEAFQRSFKIDNIQPESTIPINHVTK